MGMSRWKQRRVSTVGMKFCSSLNLCSTSSYSYVAQVLTTWPLWYYCAVCQLEKAKDAMFESAIRFACGSILCILLFLPSSNDSNYSFSLNYKVAYSSSNHLFTMLVIDFMLKLNSLVVSKIFVQCYWIAVCCCLHLQILGPGFGGYSAHSTGRLEELWQEDLEVKRCCEQCQQQAAALSKLTQQLSIRSGKISCLGHHTLHMVRFYSTPMW